MLLKVFNFIIVTFLVVSGQKSKTDEDNPYEFGFTIDGEQHRHEKKDVNGIIEGEFGFITADGIYHTTVYATDENGNFKILSMRSVRISAPLDGSPLSEGQRINSLDKTNPAPQPAPLAVDTVTTTTTTAPTKHPNAPFAFTLASSTLPSCGSCGYVTTSKPLGPLPFQTPGFANPSVNNPNSPFNNPTNQKPSEVNLPPRQDEINRPQNGIGNDNYPNINNNNNNNYQNTPEQNYPGSNGNVYQNSPENQASLGPNPPVSGPNSYDNEVKLPLAPSPLSQLTITDNTIHVPGNPDIPIKDKYPGMVDGLPNGVTEKDVTDLLYKFNYTVGFHGHYEKGYRNGAKIGGYFVTGRDGLSQVVTYVADENGFRPKVKFIRLDLNSDEVPKEGTEKTFGLKHFEFVWYPIH